MDPKSEDRPRSFLNKRDLVSHEIRRQTKKIVVQDRIYVRKLLLWYTFINHIFSLIDINGLVKKRKIFTQR